MNDALSALNLFSEEIHPPQDQLLSHPLLDQHDIQIWVRRFDQIHPLVHGNKWYKLQEPLKDAIQDGATQLLSFGGAFSNHLYALAHAGQALGLRTIGAVRGEAYDPLNPLLQACQQAGMKLHYISRSDYRAKHQTHILEELQSLFGEFYLIPEGGHSALGAKGCENMVSHLPEGINLVACACGTGTTLAGIVNALPTDTAAWGVSVLKGGAFLNQEVASLVPQNQNWKILTQYHGGGYAKCTPELAAFIADLKEIPLEPVYTGKLFYAIFEEIKQGRVRPESRLLLCHTGGIYSWTS